MPRNQNLLQFFFRIIMNNNNNEVNIAPVAHVNHFQSYLKVSQSHGGVVKDIQNF